MPDTTKPSRIPDGWNDLTFKEKKFILAYFRNGGSAAAAYKAAGYSQHRPDAASYKVLRRPRVAHIMRQLMTQHKISPEFIQARLEQVAYADPADYEDLLTGKVSLKELRQQGIDTSLIAEIRRTKTKTGKVETHFKLHNAMSALNDLERINAMLTDKVEHSGKLTFEQAMQAVAEKRQKRKETYGD